MTKNILMFYASDDVFLVKKLKKMLNPLERKKLVKVYDEEIRQSNKKASTFLATADIVLLLVGPEFLDTDYCYSDEMEQAIIRHNNGNVHIIPVILRPAYWKRTLFSKIQALPKGDKPVTLQRNQNAALKEVVAAIENIAGGVVKMSVSRRALIATITPAILVLLAVGVIAGPVLKLIPPFTPKVASLTIIGTVTPGKSVIVHGANFPPGAHINLTLDSISITLAHTSYHSIPQGLYDISPPTNQMSSLQQTNQIFFFARNITVRSDGTFDAQVSIPTNWQPDSRHTIQAQVMGQDGVAQDVHARVQVRLSITPTPIAPTPTPIAPTPTPVPHFFDPHPLNFTITVDPLQLNQPNTITQVQDQVNKQLNQSNNNGRKVVFVLTYAGGTLGDNHAQSFNSILSSMPLFHNAVLKNFHNLNNPDNEFDLEIYFLE